MNNDTNTNTNNELNVSTSDGIKDDFKIDTTKFENVTKTEEVVTAPKENEEVTQTVEEVKTESNPAENNATSTIEVSSEEVKEEVAITSETVIEADVNSEVVSNKEEVVVGTIEEVSVNVDSDTFNTLSDSEVSENSVFNKKDGLVEGGMKEGAEVEKKGFPFFMVFVFVLLVVGAFFIDDIVVAVQEYQNSEKKTVEEEVTEEVKEVGKTLTLKEISDSLKKSKNVIDFESKYSVELSILVEDNNLLFTTTNYLDPISENSTLNAQFVFDKNILSISTTLDNSAFALEMSILLVKEVAILQGVTTTDLDTYISNNLYISTIDKGFAFTNSEDGNNLYQVATNVKLESSNSK